MHVKNHCIQYHPHLLRPHILHNYLKSILMNLSKIGKVNWQLKMLQLNLFQISKCFIYSGINHNVDELLVGLVAQIKLRKQNVTKSEKSVVKVSLESFFIKFKLIWLISFLQLQRFLEKLVYKIQGDYKSCTNLNIL